MNEYIIYRQGTFESFYDTPIEVNWPITDMCNYRCSYCFGQRPIEKERFSSLKQIEVAVSNIAKLRHNRIMVTLAGGEPTLHPYFYDILRLLKENLQERLKTVLIITNGSRNQELYEQIAALGEEINIKVEISIHTEYVNMDHIVNLIKMMSPKINLEFPLMFNPEKRETVHKIFNELLELRKNNPFHLIVQTLRQPPNFDVLDCRYTEDDFRWQRDATQQFEEVSRSSVSNIRREEWENAFPKTFFWDIEDKEGRKIITDLDRNKAFQIGLLNFKGMFCTMGSSILSIGPDGTCRKVHCPVDTKTHNIFEDIDAEEMNKTYLLKCPYENCGCGTNHPVPKFLDENEAITFIKTHFPPN